MSSSGDESSEAEQSDRIQFQNYVNGAPNLEFPGFI